MVTAFTPLLRRSRSFKVTDFGTNRKLIYDFLLVINTTYLLSCTVSKLWLIIRQIFPRGACPTLTLSLWVVPCQYRHKWYIAKNYICGLHFCCRKYRCIFNHFYVIRPESYWIRWIAKLLGLLRRLMSFKVTEFGTNRKLLYDFLSQAAR